MRTEDSASIGCRAAAAACLAFAWLAGCATSGQLGNVTFAYRNVDQSGRAARRPLAAGSELDIQLSPATTDVSASEFEVRGASSSNHDVLEVVSVESGREGEVVRVRAIEPGRAELSVQTSAGDDAIELLVREVGGVRLRHWLEAVADTSFEEDALAFLRGGTAQFQIETRTASGDVLAGRGVESHLEVRPDSAKVQTPASASNRFRVTVGSGDSLVLRGTPGESERSFPVRPVDRIASLNLVSPRLPSPPSSRKGAAATHPITYAERAWNERFPRPDTIEAGTKAWLFAVATFADGRRAIGMDGVVETESRTPEICAVRPASAVSSGLFGGGMLLVEAKATGTCRVEATLGKRSSSYRFAVAKAEAR